MPCPFKSKCSIAKLAVYSPSWHVGPVFRVLFTDPLAFAKMLLTPQLLLEMQVILIFAKCNPVHGHLK
jgi:hypothetical protein